MKDMLYTIAWCVCFAKHKVKQMTSTRKTPPRSCLKDLSWRKMKMASHSVRMKSKEDWRLMKKNLRKCPKTRFKCPSHRSTCASLVYDVLKHLKKKKEDDEDLDPTRYFENRMVSINKLKNSGMHSMSRFGTHWRAGYRFPPKYDITMSLTNFRTKYDGQDTLQSCKKNGWNFIFSKEYKSRRSD